MSFKSKFIKTLLAFVIAVSSVIQPVFAEENSVVTTAQPIVETTTEPTQEETEELVKPSQNAGVEQQPVETEAPVESEIPEAIIPSELPVETELPVQSELPNVTEQPQNSVVPDDAVETVEPTKDTEEPNNSEIHDQVGKTDERFEQISMQDLNDRIDLGEKLIIFSGNDGDLAYEKTKDAYYEIYQTFDDQVKIHFVELDENSINDDPRNVFINFNINEDDKNLLENNISSLINKENGSALLIKTNNGAISKVDLLDQTEETGEFTFAQFVRQHIAMSYSDLLNQVNDDIALFKGPVDSEGYVWNFTAKEEKIQSFTAPYEGYYHIDLWGADGDSDLGANAQGANSGKYTSGIGGEAGTTSGDIYLKAGETIYLGLGFRNDMRSRPGYNGGGAGWPLKVYGARSGGGDAGAIYKTERGMGRLIDYGDHKDEILMVAGGGGGAEDYFATGEKDYYCNTNSCINSRGGNGGSNPTGGSSQGAIGAGGAFQFGIGQNYASSNNSSSGGGGAGWLGGTAGLNDSLQTRGGTGGGGSSYINEAVIKNGTMVNGDGLNWEWNYQGQWGWDDGRNAGAKITFTQAKRVNLTINYLDINDNSVIAQQYNAQVPFGDEYSVPSPFVAGYSVVDVAQKTVTGIMPDHDVVIDVFYDYSKLTIHYQEFGTSVTLAETYEQRMKTGTPYDVTSPHVEGYTLFEDNQAHMAGNKLDHDEEYIVYYVPLFKPTKHIVEVNGKPIPGSQDETGVTLKYGDIVRYEIRYRNNKNITVNETFEDVLSKNVFEYIGNPLPVGSEPIVKDETDKVTLTWNLTIAPQSEGTVSFEVKIIDKDPNHETVNNWDRKDPLVNYSVTKKSNPETDSNVAFEQEIEYTLYATNESNSLVKNVVVTDIIPEGTEFVTCSHENNGQFHANENYVSFVIKELQAGQTIPLTFTVKVTKRIEDNSTFDIINIARYNNYFISENESITENLITEVKDNGNESNKTVHHVTGPKVDIVKSSDPQHLSKVNPGDTIKYTVDLVNNGTVNTNFLRVTDDIPVGTEYVLGSLSFTSDNPDADSKYAVSFGNNFDIHYDFRTGEFYYDNVNIPLGNLGKTTMYRVTYKTSEWVSKTGNVGNYEWGSNKQDNYTGTWYPRWANLGFTARNINGKFMAEVSPVNEKAPDNRRGGGKVDDPYFTSPARGSHSSNRQWVNFTTDSTPLSSLVFYVYGGDLKHGSGLADKDWYYQNVQWQINSWEQLVERQGITDWQFDKSIPDGATLVSVEEKEVDSSIQKIDFTLPGDLTINEASLPNGWNIVSNSGGIVTLNYTGLIDEQQVNNLIRNIRIKGTYGTTGDLKFNLFYTNKVDFTSTTKAGVFIAPASGTYKLEAWGADGGSAYTTGGGGAGGYVSGEIKLEAGDKIYSRTGGRGWGNMGWSAGSIEARRAANGGGVQQDEGAGGGGATHFATSDRGVLKNYNSYRDEVLLVAGGGGGSFSGGGGNSGGGGAGFGQGSDSCRTAGGGGGWSGGGCDGRGGTNYISSRMSNTSQSNGVSRNGQIKITLLNYDLVERDNAYSLALPTSDTSGGCKYVTTNGNPYVECITSDVRPGKKATMTFSVKVRDDIPSSQKTIENTAYFDMLWENPGFAGELTDKPKTPSNTIVHTLQKGELIVNAVKDSNPVSESYVAANSNIRYMIDVTNNGQDIIPYTVVRDVIPEGTTYVNNSANLDGVYVGDHVEWVLKDLGVGETRRVEFSVKVKGQLNSKFIIRNVATYGLFVENVGEAGETTVTNLPNTTNEVVHKLRTNPEPGNKPAEISVTKGSNPVTGTMLKRGDEIQYTLTVVNKGTDAEGNNILVKDYIPEGTTLKSVDGYEGGTLNKKTEVKEFVSEDKTFIEWQINHLVIKDSVTLKFTVTVDKETELKEITNVGKWYFDYTNDDYLSYEVGKIDETIYNKETNVIVHPLQDPIIKAEKSADPESGSVVARGRNIKYTISVTNDSDVLANYVAVSDVVPEETKFNDGSIILSTVTDEAKYVEKTRTVEALLYDMQPHETRTITFVVTVKDDIRDGDYIYNTAYYEHFFKKPGIPGETDFKDPTNPTNTTIHTVDIKIDVLPTGGKGWNGLNTGIGTGLILLGVLAIFEKKRH